MANVVRESLQIDSHSLLAPSELCGNATCDICFHRLVGVQMHYTLSKRTIVTEHRDNIKL